MIIEKKTNQSNYSCYYVDHTFFDAREIGRLYSGPLKEIKGLINETNSVLLSTCQRIELYTVEKNNPIKSLFLPFKEVNGALAVTRRITSICSGIYSQILGEKNIFEQVKITNQKISQKNIIKPFFDKGLHNGKMYRENFTFYAKYSYEDIALNLLETSDPDYKAENLVVIGSGMLARGILNIKKIFNKYKHIYFITRDTKNLRKRISSTIDSQKITAMKIENFLARVKENYHCLIATTNVNYEYNKLIHELLVNKYCFGIFDLSSYPLSTRQSQFNIYYSDIYQNDYLDAVSTINESMYDLSKKVSSKIEDMHEDEQYSQLF